jgi:hypothetical protein
MTVWGPDDQLMIYGIICEVLTGYGELNGAGKECLAFLFANEAMI